MRIERRTRLSATAPLACLAMLVLASSATATAAKSGAPPYCVLKGGARGMPLPQICRFYGYQECLQAAADLNGNCVVNMDYHGNLLTEPGGLRRRY